MKTSLTLLLSVFITSLAFADVTQTIEETHPFAADGVIRISNVNGTIDITGWDRAEIRISAVKTGKTQSDLDRIAVTIDAQPDRLVISTKQEKRPWWLWWKPGPKGSVRYTLRVPATVTLEKISTVNSNVAINGVTGLVRANTVNGRVEAYGLAAAATLTTVNGGTIAAFARVPEDVHIKLETVNGSCEVRLPAGVNARLNASTVNGSVRCDLPVTTTKSTKKKVQGTLGNGGTAAIDLSTVNGSVSIRGN